jgi:hypothetical protein
MSKRHRYSWTIDGGIALILAGLLLGPLLYALGVRGDGLFYYGLVPGGGFAVLGVVWLIVGGIINLARRLRGQKAPMISSGPADPPPFEPPERRRIWIDLLAIVILVAAIEFLAPAQFLARIAPIGLGVAAAIARFYFYFTLSSMPMRMAFRTDIRRKMLWWGIALMPLAFGWWFAIQAMADRFAPPDMEIPDWMIQYAAGLPSGAFMLVGVFMIFLSVRSQEY